MTVTERPRRIALVADRLFDGTATLVPAPVVLIEGDRIAAVGHGITPPPDADVVDLAGATLLPGLVDTHVHLCFDASADPVATLAARDDDAVIAAMAVAGRAMLRGGVTTVRDLGDRDYLSLRLRGSSDMPTMLAAGPPLTTAGGHCHFLGGVAEDPVAAVREHVERGADVIKIMASGGSLTPGSRQELPQFELGWLRAAVAEAHRYGLPVVAHAHATAAIRNALDSGVDGIEHVTFWSTEGVDVDDALISRLAASGVVIGATLGQRPMAGVAPPPAIVARMPLAMQNLRRIKEGGGRVVAGSDAGVGPPKPADALRYAPAQMGALGFSPADALRSVTSGAAEVLGLADRKGRLAVGYDADVLAVDGDPLADASALHAIRAVYARGRRVETQGEVTKGNST